MMKVRNIIAMALLASTAIVGGVRARGVESVPAHEMADGRIQMPIAACLQYQRVKSVRGSSFAPFRKYGFHPISYPDSTLRLWGYRVYRDSTYTSKKPLYRIFRMHDLSSFAIIENSGSGSCQYVFWWKGYYRKFVSELREMGFAMSNVPGKTNVLRFSRDDISVVVDFIIWEDLYVMEVKGV